MELRKLKEEEIIRNLYKEVKDSDRVLVGIGDDTSVVKRGNEKYVLFTTDMLIQGIHFDLEKQDITPQDVGRKLLAVNLSDIAAMGGAPKYAVVAVGVPEDISLGFLQQVYRGLSELAEEFNVDIVGGDLSSCDRIVLNLSLVGEIDDNILLRENACKGQAVFVTGSLGGSKYGKHFKFSPRIKEANFLKSNFNISSMIDISDGLVKDAYRIAQASGVKIEICKSRIPLSEHSDSIEEALYGGEEFELLFTMDSSYIKELQKIQPINNVPVTYVGKVGEGKPEVVLYDENQGKKSSLDIKGYDHFYKD